MSIEKAEKVTFYQALLDKNSEYDGVFYVGVKTTGIFCRPTCPARKPKFENCEFFKTAKDAIFASYRPCLRCSPISHPNKATDIVRMVVDAVEANPEKKWRERDFAELCDVDISTIRRQFKKRFGMTIAELVRAMRIGRAVERIRAGEDVIEAQLDAGYESGSGFRDAFSKIMGAPPTQLDKQLNILKCRWIDTPLGPMIAIADDEALFLLEFMDRRALEKEIENLRKKTNSAIIPGRSAPLAQIEEELKSYFAGELKQFTTPYKTVGTAFQQKTWRALCKIPYGTTRSYLEQANIVGNSKAVRAVARANGANQLAIIIPCHRIINTSGEVGGYGGGIGRKKWLIEHEDRYK